MFFSLEKKGFLVFFLFALDWISVLAIDVK